MCFDMSPLLLSFLIGALVGSLVVSLVMAMLPSDEPDTETDDAEVYRNMRTRAEENDVIWSVYR
jgi:hypothetical protein